MKSKKQNIVRALIVILLAAAVGVIIYAKNASRNTAQVEIPKSDNNLPKLIDLGATKCIPCKMMAPILEELKKEYAGKMDVEFIDVWENPNAGQSFGIKLIPTQIFFAPDGKELFRHEGFFSREDILGKWKELGYDFAK
jgi:thioredoxin 1